MTTSESHDGRANPTVGPTGMAGPTDASASPDHAHVRFLDDGTSEFVLPSSDGAPALVLKSCNDRPLPEGMLPAFG